ncbi:MAG: ATP-binding protein [Pseudomonadota bacterium]|nr:ATP-binding protein [Pseudomonadota bacterium]
MLVRVTISPIKEQNFTDGQAYTISFMEEQPRPSESAPTLSQDDDRGANADLEQELAETKSELQNTIEELETSTEELRASHEEALSTNEELQSTNEELEASSEELRSLNEELNTVNAQLKDKLEQLRHANNDLANFFSSTDIPTLFLDPDLKIQRYTPAAESLLKIGPRDLDHHISSLQRHLVEEDLIDDCQQVLRNFQPVQREVKDFQGRWYIRQITPYRTEARRIEGVVLAFQDVTKFKTLNQRAQQREEQQAVVAKLGMLALSGTEPVELMQQAVRHVAHVFNADYCKVLRFQPEQHNLRMVAGFGWPQELVGKATVADSHFSQAGFTLRSKEPVIVDNLMEEKRFSGPALLLDYQVRSGISCLINHTDPPYGVLGVHAREQRKFTQEDATFLQSVANMLSTAIRTKEAVETIHESEQRLKMARDAGNIGIHDYDIQNQRMVWDETHRQIWGISQELEPITYQTFEQALHPDDKDRINREIATALEQPGNHTWEFRVINAADRTLRFVVLKGQVIHSNGRPSRLVATVQDVTERKRMEQSLRQAVWELEQVDQRKNEFLSILGHELRNPLAAISGGLEMLEQDQVAEPKVFEVMQHSVETMRNLLDDLLDLNRVSQNKIELAPERVDVRFLLDTALQQATPQCNKKQQILVTDIKPGLQLVADPTRLEQVFTNLLVNACKYTPRGGQIDIKAYQADHEIRVHVRDSGLGILPEDLDRIFDPFFQVTPENQAPQGLGVGLALAKKLVEMHKGTIEAHSEGPGRGSVFTVILPIQNQLNSAAPAPEKKTTADHIPRQKVLLIEDNENILFTLQLLLESLNCEVSVASSGLAGVEKIASFEPDVVLVDIGLPDISGHEVAAQARANGYRGLLVALSGYSHQEVREKSRQVGFDHHLAKPATMADLSAILTPGN